MNPGPAIPTIDVAEKDVSPSQFLLRRAHLIFRSRTHTRSHEDNAEEPDFHGLSGKINDRHRLGVNEGCRQNIHLRGKSRSWRLATTMVGHVMWELARIPQLASRAPIAQNPRPLDPHHGPNHNQPDAIELLILGPSVEHMGRGRSPTVSPVSTASPCP